MSIEKKKPTKEFYSALDDVITHQVKSREAFDRAIEIARKQDFDDLTIGLFIKDYLKDKIPKTSLYRYLKEINPNTNAVPMEQIYYNNVLDVKDQTYEELLAAGDKRKKEMETYILNAAKRLEQLGHPKEKICGKITDDLRSRFDELDLKLIGEILPSEYKESVNDILKGALTSIKEMEKNILNAAKTFEGTGYTKEKIIAEIIRECNLQGYGEMDLKYIDRFLHSELN